MDPISFSVGIVSGVIQVYGAVTAAYDTYIQVVEFPASYQELRMGLMIERYRLDLWGRHVLAEYEIERGTLPTHDIGLWKLFEAIFTKILEAFQENHQMMENYGTHTGILKQEGLSEWELLESMSIATKSPPKHSLMKFPKTLKFVLREKRKMEQLLQQLCYWNDSLDRMTSRLDQESSRRRLRAHFSTGNTSELRDLKAAAALLKHQDLERMATARTVIEQGNHSEPLDRSEAQSPDNLPSTPPPEYRLEMDEFKWQDIPYKTDRPRAMATWNGQSVIIDWRTCHDDSWRRGHPVAFRKRTENLAKILNTDLRPLNLSVLHCVGYLDRNSNVTGYAFRLPPGADPGQNPVTLHHLLCNVRKADDIPDLGERFRLAKALVSTVFEIHNLGWLHKNIQPKNILFWPKPNSTVAIDISKPYLMGFDIARPNQEGEFSEKPPSRPEDDLYRHPAYKGAEPHSFLPSFDMYSLGVVLYEIGFWRRITVASQAAPRTSERPPIPTYNSDPQYIETLVKNGSVSEMRRFMGTKYRDAVIACLKKEFDEVWEKQQGNRQQQLQTYLGQVQNKIVDAIAVCSA
ncbi:hypothetical protein N7G274_001223 [Stereocaulon virgatum]|uniref:Protein kinase domain-containing protein n=1 Tax=Stereocaulon virgatum TaxID=373712 RepID=A0ABR4AN73_9LECA